MGEASIGNALPELSARQLVRFRLLISRTVSAIAVFAGPPSLGMIFWKLFSGFVLGSRAPARGLVVADARLFEEASDRSQPWPVHAVPSTPRAPAREPAAIRG
jgi:hypothetical protein